MDRAAALQKIAEVFEDVMDVEPEAVTEEANGDSIPEWDSLSHVRLMVAIERRFAIRFSNGEIEAIKSVGGVVDLVLSKAAA